jgi:hypothetical protein
MCSLENYKKLELIYLSLVGKLFYPEHYPVNKKKSNCPIIFVSHFKNDKEKRELYTFDLKLKPKYEFISMDKFEQKIFSSTILNTLSTEKNPEQISCATKTFESNINWLAKNGIFERNYANNVKSVIKIRITNKFKPDLENHISN